MNFGYNKIFIKLVINILEKNFSFKNGKKLLDRNGELWKRSTANRNLENTNLKKFYTKAKRHRFFVLSLFRIYTYSLDLLELHFQKTLNRKCLF